MRNLLIAAAALTATAFPLSEAQAQMGSHHWRSGGGMHWQGGHFNRGGWRGHAVRPGGWNHHAWRGHPYRGWRGDHRAWRGDGWRWRSPRRVVIVGGWQPGWGYGYGAPYGCRSLWFDGWSWRCGW